jgi:predicted aspartyl protease
MEVIKIKYQHGEFGSGQIFLPCLINGKEIDFFFDSGATFTGVKDINLLNNANIIGEHSFHGASGRKLTAQKVICESLSLSGIKRNNFEISLYPNEYIHETTLGINFLKGANFQFLSSSQAFSGSEDHSSHKNKFSFSNKGHICFEALLTDQVINTVWDTGAELTVVSKNLIARYPHLFSNPVLIKNGQDSSGGNVDFILWDVESLNISDKNFNNFKAIEMDFQSIKDYFPAGTEVILGFNLITQADWQFNLESQTYEVTPL